MNMKKLLCMVLAMLMALSAMALAEPEEDLQAQLDAANARVAELEAQVALYKPYYEMQVVAEYGDGGVIWLEDAMKEYESAASAYAQYGLSIDDFADDIKEDILKSLVKVAVIDAKAEELGLSQLDEETVANLQAEAAETFETYVDSYRSYFAAEDATDEEARAQTIAALESYGLTQDALAQQTIDGYVDEQLYNYVTADVAVTDEDVQAKYDAMVAEAQESYTDDYVYNNARNSGETIAWNPEGYRAVKHVLVKFSDEQAQEYSELQSTLESLNAELEALDNPEEAAEEAAEEAEEEDVPRTREEIQTDIGNIGVSIEALYSTLMPRAQEVIDAFNAGTDIDTLIDQYGEDPGMTAEPAKSQGYAVAENSTYWDPAFTEGAMSIAEVGQISEPVRGQYGIHIIYYLADITPGEVPFEDIQEGVAAAALEDKITQTYNDQVDAWIAEVNPTYHLDRF